METGVRGGGAAGVVYKCRLKGEQQATKEALGLTLIGYTVTHRYTPDKAKGLQDKLCLQDSKFSAQILISYIQRMRISDAKSGT
jgi:hypothetical protein